MIDQPNCGRWPQPLRLAKYLTFGERPVVTRMCDLGRQLVGMVIPLKGLYASMLLELAGFHVSQESGYNL